MLPYAPKGMEQKEKDTTESADPRIEEERQARDRQEVDRSGKAERDRADEEGRRQRKGT